MSVDQRTIDSLNSALRVYRRLGLRLLALFVLGFAVVIALGYLSTALRPPYGLYILGEDPSTWGMVVLLLLILGEFWWESRQVRQALDDPNFPSEAHLGLLSGLTVMAQRAKAIGMEWSGFYGPLRPARGK